MKNKLKNINKKTIIGSLLVFISSLIVTSIIWGNRTFSVKTLNQIIFHLKVPMEGTDNGIYLDWFIFCVPISILIMTLQNIIVFNLYRVIKKYGYKVYCFIRKNFVKWGIICLISSLIFTIHNYDIYGYIVNAFQKTDIYEAYYVDPSETEITFTKEKRNLIHLYLESVENTYASLDQGGAEEINYIPELSNLAKENINFLIMIVLVVV